MHLNATQQAALLAYRKTLPKGKETPPTPALPAHLDNIEGNQLWRQYAVLLQATPIKK